MANILNDRKYTHEHEWAKIEDNGNITVGISDYAQEQLGDIVFVELPEIGMVIEKNKSLGFIEAVKTVSELFAPVGGTIIDKNTEIENNISEINSDCYSKGWLVKIQPCNSTEFEGLLSSEEYTKLIT